MSYEADGLVGPDEVTESFRDRHSNTTKEGKRKWVYALKPKGKLYNYRKWLSWFYFALFFALPLIKVNGMPLVQFNFTEGKFILFTKIFWPNDFFFFAVAMIAMIIFIALFTIIYGRVFCGWICPQTVFLEFFFRPIEWAIEGNPAQQKKLDAAPWTGSKIFKKVLKHSIYFVISFIIAHTFLAYILGIDEVWKLVTQPISENVGIFFGLLFFTALFFIVFAYIRDIVCTTICPYGRLQSVLFDKDTMQVSYDYVRGEPRGKIVKGVEQNLGDCVDCKLCVQVCPTGIDIRDGVQMECVGCTACIDACNGVMEKVNRPLGLIRMASENEIEKKEKFHFNFRMKAYTVILLVLIALMAFLIITRKSVDTSMSRVKGQLYQEIGTDSLSNLFSAKIINKTKKDMPYEFRLEDISGRIRMVNAHKMELKGESINDVTFFIDIPKSAIKKRTTDIKVGVYSNGERLQS
ncbi:MAG: cytochrome c oxidase accessory protein CcoG, partial [Sphingobacteriales bacterium 41-5]